MIKKVDLDKDHYHGWTLQKASISIDNEGLPCRTLAYIPSTEPFAHPGTPRMRVKEVDAPVMVLKCKGGAECPSRPLEPKMTHTVKVQWDEDRMVDNFANDEEAVAFMDFLKEKALEHPGISPLDMISPGTRDMLIRWLSKDILIMNDDDETRD